MNNIISAVAFIQPEDWDLKNVQRFFLAVVQYSRSVISADVQK